MSECRRYQSVVTPHDIEPFPKAGRDVLLRMTAVEKRAEDLPGVDDGLRGGRVE